MKQIIAEIKDGIVAMINKKGQIKYCIKFMSWKYLKKIKEDSNIVNLKEVTIVINEALRNAIRKYLEYSVAIRYIAIGRPKAIPLTLSKVNNKIKMETIK